MGSGLVFSEHDAKKTTTGMVSGPGLRPGEKGMRRKGEQELDSVRKQLVALLEPKQLPTPLERRHERGGRIREVARRGEKSDKLLPGWSPPNIRRPATAASIRDRSSGRGRADYERSKPRSSSVNGPLPLAGPAGLALRTSSARFKDPWQALALDRGPRPAPAYPETTGDAESRASSVIRDAVEQASHDKQVLSDHRCSADLRSSVRQGHFPHQVQAALLRQGTHDALALLLSERDQLKGEVRVAKAQVKDLVAVQKHLQRTISVHDEDRINLVSDRALGQRQIDSIQDSVQEILVHVERTVEHLHAHTQRVMHDARTSLSKAQSEVTDEKSKLQAQAMVADKLSEWAMHLTAERDAANALAAQKEKHNAELLAELEQRDSVDDLRYDHECNVRDLQRRFTDKKADIVGRFVLQIDGRGLHMALVQWRIQAHEARDASQRARIRAQALQLERANAEALFWRNMYDEMHAQTQQLLGQNSSPAMKLESSAVEQSAGSCESPATTILAASFGGTGLGARLSTVEGLQREITSLRKTLEVVQEAKVDGQSTRGAAGRVDTQIDHACAALESKQMQIVDLHSQLLALKGTVNPHEMEKRLREKERGRERELGTNKARQKAREQKARAKAAAAAEAQILKTLAADQITFEANSAKLTDKGSSLVRRVSPAIRGLGRMVVEIHGHCKCDCGNNDLSHARASAVADRLKEEGCENDFVIVPHADLHPEIRAQMLVRIVPRPDTAGSTRSDEVVRAGDLQRASGKAFKDDNVSSVCGSLMHSSSSGSVSSVDSDTEIVAGQAAMEDVCTADDGSNLEGVKMWAGSGSGKASDPSFAQRCNIRVS